MYKNVRKNCTCKIRGQRGFNSLNFKLEMLYIFQHLFYKTTLYVLHDPVTMDLKGSFILIIAAYLLIYNFNSKICINSANKNKKWYTYWYNQHVIKKIS